MTKWFGLVLTLLVLLVALPNVSSASVDAVLSTLPPPPEGTPVLVLDANGHPITTVTVDPREDARNMSISIEVSGRVSGPIQVLASVIWIELNAPHPAFANRTFAMTEYLGLEWYDVPLDGLDGTAFVNASEFRPTVEEQQYTMGSPGSVQLERPMFVSLTEVPHVEFQNVTQSNANGTWAEQQPYPTNRLGIAFVDSNISGQTIVLNKTWLSVYGLTNVSFSYADETPIANTSDEWSYFLEPPHFSVIYAFTGNDYFVKESDQTYSDLHWDSTNRNIYLLSDRRDPANMNEMYRNNVLNGYDDTTSFTIRATWQTSSQGNWQLAVPIFFMYASNTRIDLSSSIYVLYASRASNLGWNPYYYLRYRDSGGTLRVNQLVVAPANVQLEFLIDYNGYTRNLIMAVYYVDGTQLGSASYVLPSTDHPWLAKFGAAAWGSADTNEPTTIAKVDNIYFDANMALNGNYEADSNADGVPDNWLAWIWSKGPVYRSSDRAKFGSWSVRIWDTSSSNDYGLQTNRIPVNPGYSFTGSSWVYVTSGSFALCLELWNAPSGGTRLSVSCKNTAYLSSWEYLDINLAGPSATSYVDLLVYSSSSNQGIGYFDGGELHLRRAFWSISHHDGEHASWQQAVDLAADLGVSYIRTDLRWAELETGNGVFDTARIAYWRSVINLAKTRGIGIIAILNGPEPSWTLCTWSDWQYSGECPQAYYDSFGVFCQRMAQEFRTDLYYYQILNEFSWNPQVPGAFEFLAKACFNGILQGEGLATYDHKSGFKTIFNVYANTAFWDDGMRAYLGDPNSGPAIDVAAVDHYPGTYTGSDCNDWAPLDALSRDVADFNKEGALMETGFSSYAWPYHTDWDENNWVNCALPNIHNKAKAQLANDPKHLFILGSFYDLVDGNSNCGPFPECHFGLLWDNLSQKTAYASFRTQAAAFTL